MNYPKISIVTPNFNGGVFLEETIKSVLSQKYPNLEYIIIDGGSSDCSVEIIKKYEDKIAYWISEPDNGLYHAIQKGFEKSSGEIMAWINSDDMYAKGGLSIVSEIFLNFKEVNWLVGMPSAYDEKGRTIRIDAFKQWSKFDFYTKDYEWIQQESVFWRRCLWNDAGSKLNTSLKLAGDLELWTRFFRFDKIYSIDALLSGFRVQSKNQLSLDFLNEYHKEAQIILDIELKNLVKQDLAIIKKINKHKKAGANSHHIIRFFHNYFIKKIKKKYYNYAPKFYFDRISQSFKLNN